ncbi:hypothetical protein TNCV_216611 [Trichonephila clavipes]|nr:hypothetical protein TNCV_216611 [Trichonephila clavipes]
MMPKWLPKSPNWLPTWSSKVLPTWLYRRDFAQFLLNRHYNNFDDVGTEEEIRRPNSNAKSHDKIPVAISQSPGRRSEETRATFQGDLKPAEKQAIRTTFDSREDECETQDFTGDHAPINQRPTESRRLKDASFEEVQKC